MRLIHDYGTGHSPCIRESDRELPLVHLSIQKIGAVKIRHQMNLCGVFAVGTGCVGTAHLSCSKCVLNL